MKNFIRYLIVIGLILDLSAFDIPLANDLGNSSNNSNMLRKANQDQLDVSFKPLKQNGDEITLELSLKGKKGLMNGEIKIHVQVGKNIILKSPEKIEEILKNVQEKKYTIELSVPKGVSSSVSAFTLTNSYPIGGRSRLFIRNTEDSMEFSIFPFPVPKVEPLYQKPNWDTMTTEQLAVEYEVYFQLRDEESYQFIKNYADTLIPSYKKDVYKVKLTLGEILELGKKNIEGELVHRPPWDKRTTPWKNLETPPDTTKMPDTVKEYNPKLIKIPESEMSAIRQSYNQDSNEELREEKRLAEKYILTDKAKESFYIDGVMYQRVKGEQYFRVIKPITDTHAYSKHINDSLAALPDDHLYELCIMIPEDKQSEAVEIIGVLPEPVKDNYYHMYIKKGDIPKLQKAGIPVTFSTKLSCNHTKTSSRIDSKKN